MKHLNLVFFFLFCCVMTAIAADPEVVVIEPKILSFLDKLIGMLPTSGYVATVATIVIEAILRLWKSEKPLSILLLISAVLKKLAILFSKLAEFLDKVIPQRTNSEILPPK